MVIQEQRGRSTAPLASRLSPAVSIVALTLAGSTTALAAAGKPLIIGATNKASATTTLATTKGPALALKVKGSRPPLVVNTSTRVTKLNADLLDGQDASDFVSARGVAGNSDLLDGLDSAVFARKDDLAGLAKKDELAGLARKSDVLPDWSGYTIMVAGNVCPPGTAVQGLAGHYGAENQLYASTLVGMYLYQVEYSNLLSTYVLERDVAPLIMTACRVP